MKNMPIFAIILCLCGFGFTISDEVAYYRSSEPAPDVLLVLSAQRAVFKQAFVEYLDKHPDTQGRILLRIKFAASGAVTEVKSLDDNCKDSSFVETVTHAAYGLKCLACGGSVVQWPLIFSAD